MVGDPDEQVRLNAAHSAWQSLTVSAQCRQGICDEAQGHCIQVGHLELVAREDQIATLAKLSTELCRCRQIQHRNVT